jgi:hypothetical protein
MTLPRRGPVLDHHYGEHRDERNKLFGVRRLVAAPPRPPSVLWAPGPVLLNQGETGHCGGFGAANEAQASPVRVRHITNEWAHGFYYDIKDRHLDPFGREDGTTTQAVMDLYRLRGMARSYAWAFNLTDFRAGLTLGPLLVGTAYLARMFEPNRDGFAEVAGADEGGHLWLCTGSASPPTARSPPSSLPPTPHEWLWRAELLEHALLLLEYLTAQVDEGGQPQHRHRHPSRYQPTPPRHQIPSFFSCCACHAACSARVCL